VIRTNSVQPELGREHVVTLAARTGRAGTLLVLNQYTMSVCVSFDNAFLNENRHV
jgi:hypothetical protein